MKRTRPALVLMLAVAVLAACRGPEPTAGTWELWQSVDNAYAGHFRIWRHGEDRLMIVFGHGGEQDTVGIYAFTHGPGDAPLPIASTRFQGPLRTIALGSTTHVPYISVLGHVEAVIACGHMDQVRDTAFIERARLGACKEIATGDGLDREALLELGPGAFSGYPFGRGETSALQGLGIPTVEICEYLEEHPLGRAEWLRFFGVLFGEEHKADSLFNGIRERYEALRVDSSMIDRPTVLFGSVWDGQWWVPPGNSYMARLIEDAGGRYLFADRKGDGNIAVDMETMIATASNADAWGMIASVPGELGLSVFTNNDTRLKDFKAIKTCQLFIGNSANTDLFGQALLEPDEVLADLHKALHPFAQSGRRSKYFTYFIDPEFLKRMGAESRMIQNHRKVELRDTAR